MATHEEIRRSLEKTDSNELRDILEEGDRRTYTEEAFTIIAQILTERGVEFQPPPGKSDTTELGGTTDKSPEEPSGFRPGGVRAVLGVTAVLAVMIGSLAVLPTVDGRGNVVHGIDLFPVLIVLFLIVIFMGLRNGSNWARWSICAMPVIGALFGFGALFGLDVQDAARLGSGVQLLLWLVLFVPFLFTKSARLYFEKGH